MTSQEWKQRSAERILRAVRKAGKMRIRALKRVTNYNRGPRENGADIWMEALEYLESMKLIVIERARRYEVEGDDDLGIFPEFVMTPQAATLSRMGGG
jgi:hypothetical protein